MRGILNMLELFSMKYLTGMEMIIEKDVKQNNLLEFLQTEAGEQIEDDESFVPA